ncbi:MAG: OHCU decarboxylase, partial [Candidatus Melainabacteria bacterium HGW-Melainabacteria-1]
GSVGASEETLSQLAEYNARYQEKFGFIFIVCATGKTADEMLELLKQRLPHDTETELRIAAGEQRKITRLRLEKLL